MKFVSVYETIVQSVGLTQLLFFIRHLYLNGVYSVISLDLRLDTIKKCIKRILAYVLKIYLTILGSIVNMFWGDLYDHLMRLRIFTSVINELFV